MLIRECIGYINEMDYLGDGAYVGRDSLQLWIAAERDGQVHKIALDGGAVIALLGYAKRVGLIRKGGE